MWINFSSNWFQLHKNIQDIKDVCTDTQKCWCRVKLNHTQIMLTLCMQLGAMNFRKHWFWVDDSPNYRGFLVCSLVLLYWSHRKGAGGQWDWSCKRALGHQEQHLAGEQTPNWAKSQRETGRQGEGAILGPDKRYSYIISKEGLTLSTGKDLLIHSL